MPSHLTLWHSNNWLPCINEGQAQFHFCFQMFIMLIQHHLLENLSFLQCSIEPLFTGNNCPNIGVSISRLSILITSFLYVFMQHCLNNCSFTTSLDIYYRKSSHVLFNSYSWPYAFSYTFRITMSGSAPPPHTQPFVE